MQATCFIPFSTRIESVALPDQLNDPFGAVIPEICKIAALELQVYLTDNQYKWKHNFGINSENQLGAKGKMFGVLVVKNTENELGFLATFSGKMADEQHPTYFVPSLFDVSSDDSFITKGMLELKAITEEINGCTVLEMQDLLREKRKNRSFELQNQLFTYYNFLNAAHEVKSLNAIFEATDHKVPPAGAGECSAPKLLQYAFENGLTPVAIAEFWWGKSNKSGTRKHLDFYPACRDKCLPILTYMLGY